MATFSIRTELLGLRPTRDLPEATSLIRLLLEAAASKAEATEYGILTGFSIVRTARLSCDQIDETIAVIDGLPDDADDADAWSKLKKYWEDIRTLEDLLLKTAGFFSATEVKPEPKSVIACLSDVEKWEAHREELKNELKALQEFLHKQKDETAPTTPTTWDQQRDDAAMIHSLISLLTGETSGLSVTASSALTELKTALSTIDPAAHRDGIVHVIKGAWIAYAAAWESKNGTDRRQKSYLSSMVVWNAVKSFSTTIKGGKVLTFQTAYGDLKKRLTGEYRGLESLNHSFIAPTLATVTVATQHYLKVIKAAKGVRRPFMGLNNLLVKYCSELVALHNGADHGTKLDNDGAVTSALQYAVDAADAAKNSLPGTAPWKGELADKSKVDTAFNKAFDSMKPLFQTYKPGQLTDWDKAKNDAATADDDRFNLLKASWLKTYPTPVTPTGSEVTVHIKSDATSIPRVVKILDSAQIDMLIWREGHQFTGAKDGSNSLKLGKTIGELNLGGKTIEIT